MLALIVASITVTAPYASGGSESGCVQEFDKCVMDRDCCDGLNCITGDWQYTTDSTCLSERSEAIDKLNLSTTEKIDLVEQYYRQESVKEGGSATNGKCREDIEKLVSVKYDMEFSKLVSKLEGKYKVLFDFNFSDSEL